MFKFIKSDSNTSYLCVLGVLKTELGIQIRDEMLEWLLKYYHVILCEQEPPGILFEWPALFCAQDISIRYNIPVLYLHTKGAANPNQRYSQVNVRTLWADEFGQKRDDYMRAVNTDTPTIACPIIGTQLKITWWNGFIANPNAFKSISLNEPSPNRYIYECLWQYSDVNVYGGITSSYNKHDGTDKFSAVAFINAYTNMSKRNEIISYWHNNAMN